MNAPAVTVAPTMTEAKGLVQHKWVSIKERARRKRAGNKR
jgi:hypothetical protein